jgi:alpha-beta hydrolase superfamily lysophospholipase
MRALSIQNPWAVAGISIAAFLVGSFILMNLAATVAVFYKTVYRSPKKERTRECTNKKDPEQLRIFKEGIEWAKQYADKTEKLHIVNDGLNLYGEYIDFGFGKCAVILPGRTESLLYSYYFADVYAKNGYNILVVDVRAHGLSDGKYGTTGIKESGDLAAWVKHIEAKYGIANFTFHGICVGGATAVYAYAKLKKEGGCPVKKIVTDGMFQSAREIYKRNIRKYKQPAFPVLQLVFLLTFLLAKARLFTETPLKYMKDIDIPILFIWSVKDVFCVQAKSRELFDACASKDKEVRFFPEGRHSHVRSVQTAEYDQTIAKFLQK